MKFISFVATTLCLAVLQCLESASISIHSPKNVAPGGSPRLVNLGTVDGKSFFADRIGHTWVEAKLYCQSLGMDLATITTSAQITFLKNAYNTTTFVDGYWIGGRDSFEQRQFTWDKTNAPVTSLSSLPLNTNIEYQTCLVYNSVPAPSIWLLECNNRLMYTLCET